MNQEEIIKQNYNPDKHVGFHPETGIPLVKSKHEYKKPKSAREEKREYKPLMPWFCPVKDPVSGEKCGKMMGIWDNMTYDRFGMCEECTQKYNPQLFEKEMEEFVSDDGSLKFKPL